MSHTAFDFLSDSFLLEEDSIRTRYVDHDDSELALELGRYREHLTERADDLRAEIADDSSLSISFDTSSRSHPSVDLLKQCALYFDRAVVDDPLFTLTRSKNETEVAVSTHLGFEPHRIDRDAIASAALFMRTVRPMAAARFLKFLPISALLEPPAHTPVTYSPTLHKERIPADLYDWIQARARVAPLRRHPDSGRWYWRPGDSLTPNRAICITFEGYDQPSIYFLYAATFLPDPDDPRQFSVRQWLPDSAPSQAEFETWVQQSVNQAGGKALDNVAVDLGQAARAGSMLLTESQFVSDLLSLRRVGTSLAEDLARMALRLDLPVLEAVSVTDLMTVRSNHGEAFQAFRLAVQKQLRELRLTTDESLLLRKLQNMQHELEEVQIADIRRETQRVRREVIRSLVVGSVSVAAVVPTTGWSLAGLVPAALGAYKASTAYTDRVKEHQAFFLWQLRRRAGATSTK